MPNSLLKIVSPSIPAIPGIDGTAGSPGTPDIPAYCTKVAREVTYCTSLPPALLPGIFPPPDNWFGKECNTYTEYTKVCYPATYGTPPIAPTPGTAGVPATDVDFNFGWNAGAISIDTLASATPPTPGKASFSVPVGAKGVVVGLCHPTVVTHLFDECPHALYFVDSSFVVLEYGVAKTASAAFVTADVFSIARVGATVRYYKGSTLLYVSEIYSWTQLSVVGSLYAGGDKIINAALVAPTQVGFGSASIKLNDAGNFTQSFAPMASVGGLASQAGGAAAISPLNTAATGYTMTGAYQALQPLDSFGSKGVRSKAVASLKELTSLGSESKKPAKFALHHAEARGLVSVGFAHAGGISIKPLTTAGDSRRGWAEGMWEGYTATITAGTGAGQSKIIATNTAQQLFFSTPWSVVPDETSEYTIS